MSNYTMIARCRVGGGSTLINVLDLGEQALTGVFPKTRDARLQAVRSDLCGARIPAFCSSRTPTIWARCMATITATAPASTAAWLTI